MTSWSKDLDAALNSGDPQYMQAMLAQVPPNVLQQAIPYIYQMAKSAEQEGRLEQALVYHDQLIKSMPGYVDRHADRARLLLQMGRAQDALQDAERIIKLAPHKALGQRLAADAHGAMGELEAALQALRTAARIDSGDAELKQKISDVEGEVRKAAMLRQALDPNAAQEGLQIEMPPLPQIEFEPSLFLNAEMPAEMEQFRVEGLRQHLLRYSGQVSSRNSLNRIEDSQYLQTWDSALATLKGAKLLLHGSELGLFAARALQHGAQRVLCVENFPLDLRIAGGIVQKHMLGLWHAEQGANLAQMSEEQRHASFDAFTAHLDFVSAEDEQLATKAADSDCVLFPHVDHSLLGTGIIPTLQALQAKGVSLARVLPARAKIFAQAIQWQYAPDFPADSAQQLRWHLYPQALEAGSAYAPLSAAVCVAEIEFANFSAGVQELKLPLHTDGRLDAILFWYELDLGTVKLQSGPGGVAALPAAWQYCDPQALQAGQELALDLHLHPTRLYFQTRPAAGQKRRAGLPGWYARLLADSHTPAAYAQALQHTLQQGASSLALNIGAGSGGLALQAVQAGVGQVVACELQGALQALATQRIAAAGKQGQINVLHKDCRKLEVETDLPGKADLVVFDAFDCSLIGEGILHYLAHAREHLLTEDARYLPAKASIHAQLIEYRLDKIWDVDVNLLNPYRASTNFINVDAKKLAYRPLSAPFAVFSFDFATATVQEQEQEFAVAASADGVAGAVLFWFELELDAQTRLSNAPGAEHGLHWQQGLQFLPEVTVQSGLELPFMAKHNGSSLKFNWKLDAIPKDAFSKIPRFDPRWLAANAELEQQTQGLIQHCMHNPQEYEKVAQIAQRFALDPAKWGLDATIAQRFVGMFFA